MRAPSEARPVDRLFSDAWSRDDVQSSLTTVVQSVAEVLEFDVVAVSGRFGEDELRVVASAGRPDAGRRLRSRSYSISHVEQLADTAEQWGPLRFLDTEAAAQDDECWRPEARLFAPIRDPNDRLIGVLYVDAPRNGRRPDAVQRAQLEVFALLTGRILTAGLREQRAEQRHRTTEAARSVVRRTNASVDLEEVLHQTATALITFLGARGAWVRSYATVANHEAGTVSTSSGAGPLADLSPASLRNIQGAVTACWHQQRVLTVSPTLPPINLISPAAYVELAGIVAALQFDSVLIVPVGAGEDSLGYLALARGPEDPAWSVEERAELLTIGQDVGRAVFNARTLARERALVERLQRLDDYKRQLVSGFSHELRTPLTALGAHLELLEQDAAEWPGAGPSLVSIRRSVRRLNHLVDDLMLMSRIVDPERAAIHDPVDLAALVIRLMGELRAEAGDQVLALDVQVPDEAVLITGDSAEIERAVGEIVANALDYSRAGGRVTIVLDCDPDEVHLEVRDTGALIGPTDRARVFDDFFQIPQPRRTAANGSNLGLSIAERVVARHGGRIDIATIPGLGGTFTVVLPRRAIP